MQVRIAGVVPESFVDGSGIRFAIFMQGCLRRCEGCHNPNTHKLTDGNVIETEELLNRIESRRKILSGITLTGGEPLLQFDAALDLASGAKSLGLNVWLYTGYRYEELTPAADALLNHVDVLVDGEFILAKRDLELPFRGSSNQRLIDLNATRRLNKLTLKSSEEIFHKS
ncbi:MAG: anaerobic ribonucleoside-triphosphate reductase activating protein [Salinivirgaceae bacterium]|nr:anaerobic ribonucleoside-triphosphate reductase activating protein [Salinivirgaceae bacterium]